MKGVSADCERMATTLEEWSEQRRLGVSLDVLLGAEPGSAAAALAARDELIGRLARRFSGGYMARTDAILGQLERFQREVLPENRYKPALAAGASEVNRLLFALQRVDHGAVWPLARTRLAEIVRSSIETEQAAAPSSTQRIGDGDECIEQVRVGKRRL